MKRSLKYIGMITAAFAVITFYSCSGEKKEEATEHAHDSAAVHEHHEGAHEAEAPASPEDPGLNNGKKWKVDASTNASVKKMQHIAEEFSAKKDKTPADYKATAQKLDAAIQELINGCTMSGADHDALHKWLHPFMQQVEQLMSASEKDQPEVYKKIEQQLKDFDKYFE